MDPPTVCSLISAHQICEISAEGSRGLGVSTLFSHYRLYGIPVPTALAKRLGKTIENPQASCSFPRRKCRDHIEFNAGAGR